MLNVITPNPDAFKEKRIAAAYDYYRVRGGSNNVNDWKNNHRAYSFEKILQNEVGNKDLERQISERLEDELGVRAQGVLVPMSQFSTRSDLSAGNNTTGGYTIQNTLETDFFSSFLYNQTVALKAGVRVLPAKGNVVINVQGGTNNVQNQSENTAISDTNGLTFSQNVTMNPVRVTAETIVSRQLIQQSSLDMIALVKEDLAKNLGATLDSYILTGTVASQGINGVLNTSGVNVISTSSGNISWTTVVSFEQQIALANHHLDGLAWAVSPNVLNSWQTKVRLSGSATSSFFITDPESKRTISWKTLPTNNLATGDRAILGKWDQSVLATWGALDLFNDPMSFASTFQSRILCTLLCNWIAVRPNAFSVSSSNVT